jgi:hypothetical protein
MCAFMRIYTSIWTYKLIWVCIHAYIIQIVMKCLRTSTRMHVYMYVCIYVCVYIYIYIYIYINIHACIHTHKLLIHVVLHICVCVWNINVDASSQHKCMYTQIHVQTWTPYTLIILVDAREFVFMYVIAYAWNMQVFTRCSSHACVHKFHIDLYALWTPFLGLPHSHAHMHNYICIYIYISYSKLTLYMHIQTHWYTYIVRTHRHGVQTHEKYDYT